MDILVILYIFFKTNLIKFYNETKNVIIYHNIYPFFELVTKVLYRLFEISRDLSSDKFYEL